MQRRYEANVEEAVTLFRTTCDAPDLNLSSFPQLQAWCAERGVKAKSFDETAVAKTLASLRRRLEAKPHLDEKTKQGYEEVIVLLSTKQTMGGSSLKKLQTLIDRVGNDSRLRQRHLHIGAGATVSAPLVVEYRCRTCIDSTDRVMMSNCSTMQTSYGTTRSWHPTYDRCSVPLIQTAS